MSNRILGILVLLVIAIFGFFYWVYIYVPSLDKKADNNNTNTGNIINLVPIDEGTQITLGDVNQNDLSELTNNTGSSKEKIDMIKMDMESYRIIELGSLKFNFVEKDNTLSLYLNGSLVSTFSLVPKEGLEIKKVYSQNNEFLIKISNDYYIYNSISDRLTQIELNLGINYIKKENNFYLISTEKGIFVFNISNNSLEYNDMFIDFVYHNDGYVGVVNNKDERRQKNLGIFPQSQNVIFYYNPISKERKILYTTDLNLTKIYHEGEQIFFEENNSKVYKLENY